MAMQPPTRWDEEYREQVPSRNGTRPGEEGEGAEHTVRTVPEHEPPALPGDVPKDVREESEADTRRTPSVVGVAR